MNPWGISPELERQIRARDKKCVYCGVHMIQEMPRRGPRVAVATWEHIINDATIKTLHNIARCCVACNSSKGAKALSAWIASAYCKKRGITKATVAQVLRQTLRRNA
jgi:hypothetical protein